MGITMKHFGAFRATGALLFFPERGALTHHPEGGGGIACGNRALCEADAASAVIHYCWKHLWTMPQLCGVAVIVHTGGCCFYTENNSRLPAKTLLRTNPSDMFRSFYAVMGIASPATPIFFLRKRNKNERTVRTNGDLPLGSQGGQPWYRKKCCCSFRLSELF